MNGIQALSINHLPADIQCDVFSFLSLQDLGVAARVSKLWLKLSSEDRCWRNLFRRDFCHAHAADVRNWKDKYKSEHLKRDGVIVRLDYQKDLDQYLVGKPEEEDEFFRFCSQKRIRYIFLDINRFLFQSHDPTIRFEASERSQMYVYLRNFLEKAHRFHFIVHALMGNVRWLNEDFSPLFDKNIDLIKDFNEEGTPCQQFDGAILETECGTWNLEADLKTACDLMKTMRKTLNLAIGCFVAQSLMNLIVSPSFAYNGIKEEPGAILMENADCIIVSVNRNHAKNMESDSPRPVGQISLFQNWYNTAASLQKNKARLLFCGSFTKERIPSVSTYFGKSQEDMAEQHSLIDSHFPDRSIFSGHVVDDYESWKQMVKHSSI